jgi:hypothetical protein
VAGGTVFELDIDEIKMFGDQLRQVADEVEPQMTAAMEKSVTDVKYEFQIYPLQRMGLHLAGPLPGGFYTEKQRRYVLWAIRNGVIAVPYRRTNQLSESWQTEVNVTQEEIVGIVYTMLEYARWVMDAENQVSMFQDYWQTAQDRFDNMADDITQNFSDALDRLYAMLGA